MVDKSNKKNRYENDKIDYLFQELPNQSHGEDSKNIREKLSRYMEKKENVPKKESFGAKRRLEQKRKKENIKLDETPSVDVPIEHLKKTVYIGNLPGTLITKNLYKDFMSKVQEFGEINSIKYKDSTNGELKKKPQSLIGKARSQDRLVVYVSFESKESVEKICEESGTVWFGRHVNIDKCGRDGAYNVKKCAFIGNLAYDIEDEDLWKLFEKYGEVKLIRVIRDKNTHKSKGFAYIHYKEKNGLENLIEENNQNKISIGGRILRISRAKKQKKNNNNINV